MLKLIAKGLIFAGLLAGIVQAQQPAQHIAAGPTLPSRCSNLTGDVWILTSGITGLYVCNSSGVFVLQITPSTNINGVNITLGSFNTISGPNWMLGTGRNTSTAYFSPLTGNTTAALALLPSGLGGGGGYYVYNSPDVSRSNSGFFEFQLSGNIAQILTGLNGTGTPVTTINEGELTGSNSSLTSINREFNGVIRDTLTNTGLYTPTLYGSITECNSGASPAVCGAAPSGSIAVPAGTNSTLQVNTTAVTANSQIILTSDDSATVTSTTCNTTIASLALPPAITARSVGTSFTITLLGTTSTNPVCFNYFIIN